MKKRLIIFFSILLLILNIFIDSGIAQADYFIVGDSTDLATGTSYHITDNNLLVDTSGVYYAWYWNDTTPYNFTLFKSTDNGDTWTDSVEFDMSNDYNMQPDAMGCYIDDTDIIHIAYAYGDGSGFNISYRNYNTDTDTTSSKTHIYNVGGTYAVRGVTIAKNDDGEICIGWGEQESTNMYMKCKVYNDQAEVWGNTETIYSKVGSSEDLEGLSSDVLTNGSFVFAFSVKLTTTVRNQRVYYYDDQTDYSTSILNQGVTYTSGDVCDIAIENDDDIHLVYERSGTKINYSYYNGTWYHEQIADFTTAKSPRIALNSNDIVQIVFICDNDITPSTSKWLMGYYGSYGSWSELQFYNSGFSDDMDFIQMPYQNLQYFTHLTNGVIGIAINTTNNEIVHFDEGYELFYTSDTGDTEEWDSCSGTEYTIEKMFENSVAYWNGTYYFKIIKTNVLYMQVQITNSTGVVVKEYPLTTIPIRQVSFTPLMDYGSGTFTIRARNYGSTNWDIEYCNFTVLSDADIGGWNIFSNDFDTMTACKLWIKIPSGETGFVTLEIFDDTGAIYETNHTILTDISGDASYNDYDVDITRVEGFRYKFYLWNTSATGYPKHIHTYTIPLTIFDYSMLLNNQKSTTLYYNEKNQFTGYVTHSDLNYGIEIYNGTYSASKTPEKALPVSIYNDHYFTTNYYVSDSLVNGTYYCYLTIDGSPILDGGHCVFTYTVDVTAPPSTEDSSWYGLPYWLPYLIGVFLTLFITISPLIIAGYVTRKTRIERINIPSFVYVGFFFFGLIISVAMGFIPSYVPFVILFSMIIYFTIQWLYGKKGTAEGE